MLIGNKQAIRVQLNEEVRMSRAGKEHFSNRLKYKIYPNVFKGLHPEEVPLDMINTKEKIIQYIFIKGGIRRGRVTRWHFSTRCHAKNRYHSSYKTACIVELIEDPKNKEGYKCVAFINRRLRRYGWFYKD